MIHGQCSLSVYKLSIYVSFPISFLHASSDYTCVHTVFILWEAHSHFCMTRPSKSQKKNPWQKLYSSCQGRYVVVVPPCFITELDIAGEITILFSQNKKRILQIRNIRHQFYNLNPIHMISYPYNVRTRHPLLSFRFASNKSIPIKLSCYLPPTGNSL